MIVFIYSKESEDDGMETKFVLSRGELETPCILREPDNGMPVRVVLGVHGFGGSMHDTLLESIAEEMSLFGAAVLRFDLPAHGENLEDVMSLDNCVQTLLDAAEYACEKYPQVEDLCIFASDFGAFVTLSAMQELQEFPHRVRLVIQEPCVQMDQTVLDLAQVSLVTLEAMEWAVVPGERPIGITYSFFEELRDCSALASYPIPFLILRGDCGCGSDLADIQLLRSLNDRSRLVVIPGGPASLDVVLDLTRDWFDFEQVLLTEAY